jgi:hypothetical protein
VACSQPSRTPDDACARCASSPTVPCRRPVVRANYFPPVLLRAVHECASVLPCALARGTKCLRTHSSQIRSSAACANAPALVSSVCSQRRPAPPPAMCSVYCALRDSVIVRSVQGGAPGGCAPRARFGLGPWEEGGAARHARCKHVLMCSCVGNNVWLVQCAGGGNTSTPVLPPPCRLAD